MTDAARRGQGDLEALVLRCVWEAQDAVSPGDVLRTSGADVAYTTVMTVLTRLWEKGLLDRERRGRSFRYRPAIDEATLVAGRMEAALVAARDREGVLSKFVGSLGPDDVASLRRLVGGVGDRP